MIRVYNTLTGEKEKFEPFEAGKVKMYVCGLTVQNYSHLGHTRSAINYDVIRRYLEYKGFEVTHVQNFTDINEKIVARAREEGMKPLELADKYTRAYLEDIDKLNIKRADYYCTATDNIDEIQDMVKTLVDKGYAYESEGNVYFSVEKFTDYGKLSGRKLEDMEAGSRVEVSEDKKHPLDFALWKKVEGEEISWESPWGEGWPGWHIECSAMSTKYLGNRFDIHGGGTDLVFPHHENEIAQSEAYSGQKPFVKYWLHNGTVDIKGEKMSKSLGNFFTTREILKKFSPDVIRYFVLTKHYHSPIEFSQEAMKDAQTGLSKLINTRKRIDKLLAKDVNKKGKKGFVHEEFVDLLKARRQKFEEAMDDDFNTARAIGVIHELTRNINSFINSPEFKLNETTKILIKEARSLYTKLTGILGLKLDDISRVNNNKLLHDLIDYVLDIREEARADKNYGLADKIRDDLENMGVDIKDTPRGVEWEIKKED